MSLSELSFIAVAVLFFTIMMLLAMRNSLHAGTSSIEKINNCVNIITAKVGPDGRANLLSQLQSRAMSNSRLVSGFGIDNVFTTTDDAQAREFVRQAQAYMNAVKWEELAVTARKDVQSFLAIDPENRVPLASLVQIVSLSIALQVFVKDSTAPANLIQSRILMISNFINKIWIDSKLPEHKTTYQDYHELHNALRAVCPGLDPLNSRENPLNWLLPSFETLWRVALRTCMEVKFSTGRNHPEWSRALTAFARTPTKRQFEELFESQSVLQGESKISVQDLINEALRLYPPTRHVHRTFQFDGDEWKGIADIESLHIDKDIWGSDALRFVPERWNKLSDLQRRAFMPFGSKPFLCPAKPAFGPRVIALVVGILLTVFEGDVWYLERNDSRIMEDLNKGTRLSLRRDEYTDIVVRRRSG